MNNRDCSFWVLLLVLLLIMMIGTQYANGEARNMKGLDILALAKSNVRMISEEFPKDYAIGVLQGTFGDVIPSLDKVLQTGKPSAFRAHLVNWTCRRNKNCESGEPNPRDYVRVLARRAKAFQALHERTGKACYLSPLLEYDEQDRSKVQSWINAVKTAAPSCAIVLAPFRGATLPDYLIEKHGNEARADITSNDGDNLFDADTTKYHNAGRVITFGWTNRFNCRVSGEKTFVPPSQRKPHFCATRDDIIQATRVLRPETPRPGVKPAQCATVRNLKDAELLKTNAEDYANGDPRGNKPLFISRSRRQSLEVLAPDGKRISCFRYYGPYQGGYNRHYSGSCNRHSGVDLMNLARSEWVYLKDGSNCILVSAIRRKGFYR